MSDVTFHIKRFDPAAGAPPAFQDFVVPVEGSMTVLEALFSIQEKQDGSLAFRYCCRSSICGSCAMYINGRYRLACQSLPSEPATVLTQTSTLVWVLARCDQLTAMALFSGRRLMPVTLKALSSFA